MKRLTTFRVIYFKDTGKFYTEDTFKLRVEFSDSGTPYMPAAFEHIRELKKDSLLPGLQSGSWDGPILIDHPEGYPGLILPE